MVTDEEIHLKVDYYRRDFDTAWKYILQDFLQQFFEFCFPEYAILIDWMIPYESLEQELKHITPKSIQGKKIVDKLFKVTLKTGKKQVVFIHLEVQGPTEDEFEMRVANYQYRLHSHYGTNVFTAVILTDSNPNWRPNGYRSEFWGSGIASFFHVVKLMDYFDQIDMLKTSHNPFAAVVYISLLAMKTKNMQQRFNLKKQLARHLFQKNFNKTWIGDLFRFLEWLFHLPKELDKIYYHEVYEFNQEENQMFIPPYAEDAVNVLLQQSLKKGLEKGLEQGLEQGLIQALIAKFKKIPNHAIQQIKQANEHQKMQWMKRIFEVDTIEELFS